MKNKTEGKEVMDLTCEECSRKLVRKTATPTNPYLYRLSGLDNVRLIGITIYECPGCKERSASIPQIDELHQLIAQWLLVKKAKLNGNEIRFLRKDAEVPANHFADSLGVTPEHLSRVENGKKEVSHQIDVLARVLIALCHSDSSIRDIFTGRKKSHLIKFSPSRRKWEIKEAA